MQLKFKTMQTMHLAEGDTAEKNQTFYKHQRFKKSYKLKRQKQLFLHSSFF